ncbi:MAG: GAF domain-containing protein [Opitutae bacterium]|nr:GAF domain-containing protein [Opitutae bacterium]
MKAPLPANEEERLRVLAAFRQLDSAAEKDFDDIVQLAAAICDVPIALVSLVDRDRQWFKAKIGLNVCETSRDDAFCAHAILQTEPLVVRDATQDPRFADSSLVQGEPHLRFYAGVPLLAESGEALGTLCINDRRPRELTEMQLQALRTLARQVTVLFELRKVAADLARALANVRTLAGFLPICAYCKKVRDDAGYWSQVETFMRQRTDLQFSHSICPSCVQVHFPDL